ncbi:hypothetical protein [Rhodanobacter sp. BL-MT-08]
MASPQPDYFKRGLLLSRASVARLSARLVGVVTGGVIGAAGVPISFFTFRWSVRA